MIIEFENKKEKLSKREQKKKEKRNERKRIRSLTGNRILQQTANCF